MFRRHHPDLPAPNEAPRQNESDIDFVVRVQKELALSPSIDEASNMLESGPPVGTGVMPIKNTGDAERFDTMLNEARRVIDNIYAGK